jgi:RimJ/RimL family protein N-acetyltransferase
LRSPQERDGRRIAEVCADPEIARWTNIPSPYTLEHAHSWIALAAIERDRGTALHLVAVRGGEERVLGAVSLRLHEEPERHADAGYWVAADARRAGVAGRALRLVCGLGLEAASLPYVELTIAPDNAASAGVAARTGFTEQGRELRPFKGRLVEFAIWRRAAGPKG